MRTVPSLLAAAPALAERPTDATYDVPLPFVCEAEGAPYTLGMLSKKRVVRCALSRVCAMCGLSLENPLVFVGTADDADRLAFRVPPVHRACGEAALELYPSLPGPVLGYPGPDARDGSWALLLTGGFELERPTRRGEPVTFRPNAVTAERRTGD